MPSVTDLADDDRLVHRLGRIGEGSVTLAKVLHGKPISIRKSLGELNDAVDSYARLWASSAILLHTLERADMMPPIVRGIDPPAGDNAPPLGHVISKPIVSSAF